MVTVTSALDAGTLTTTLVGAHVSGHVSWRDKVAVRSNLVVADVAKDSILTCAVIRIHIGHIENVTVGKL